MEPKPAEKITIRLISILPIAENFIFDEYGVIKAQPGIS